MASFYLRICTRASALIRRSLHTAGVQRALPNAATDPHVWSRPVTIPLGRLSPCSRSRMNLSTEASSPSEGLILSNNFVKRMQEIHNEDGSEAPKKMLRLTVESGGCSGFQYLFSLDDSTRSDDRIFEKDGVKLVIDDISYNFVKGATVDFSEELIRSTFIVTTNPNAATGCGCGASFTVKG